MLDPQGAPRPELFVKDMLHLSPAGYAVWVPVIAALLQPLLTPGSAGVPPAQPPSSPPMPFIFTLPNGR